MLTKKQWLRKKRKKKYFMLFTITSLTLFILLMVLLMSVSVLKDMNITKFSLINFTRSANPIAKPEIMEMFLTPNDYSRPQTPLKKVNSIVVHYTANPKTGAEANRNYFENLRISKETSASSHFVIGLKGEIIQCIPLDEISFASNNRNEDTISIECCHPDETGKFNDSTYGSLIKLLAWLCKEYNLDRDDIIRHYDVNGKLCPLYYVEHEDAWEMLKNDVMAYIDENAAKDK
ncbi:peptidoglycan recognition family protein [Anaerocolumna sp. AGMB13025]|uniref:peptidoglycan recognition protein family protein n=1 Tax=Anaerocolumna sp. AGMB13025 TaxID=3039116 RepID=UPI00241FFB0D|nr:peptidoglycan recognition family protein [Anaerocolumna sp. AGMB13025]WFR58234.1 peptidoglycan recognition family protein [Anaerocolumna sp. AGMB13025]